MTDRRVQATCAISGAPLAAENRFSCSALRPTLLAFLRRRHPGLQDTDFVDRRLLPSIKAAFVEDALSDEIGELTELERAVIDSLRTHEVLASRPDVDEERLMRTVGERVADRIADFGGSWAFILSFVGFLVAWIAVNAAWWAADAPDPYPFILLNLVLSCVAALQAPVIMMSQNRQEARDRLRAEQDYRINLKAELEIRHLHEKLDHLLHHHGERLLEIQGIQTEMLRQLVDAQGDGAANS